MPKGTEQSKSVKKKPQHTLKEKRQLKKQKRFRREEEIGDISLL